MDKQKFQQNKYPYFQLLEEARKEVFTLANEAMQLGNYKRAEQILRDELYKIDFYDYQKSIQFYHKMNEMADTDPEFKIIWGNNSLEYLEIIEKKKQELNNFDQRISPLILKIRKLAEGEAS